MKAKIDLNPMVELCLTVEEALFLKNYLQNYCGPEEESSEHSIHIENLFNDLPSFEELFKYKIGQE